MAYCGCRPHHRRDGSGWGSQHP
ncbi:hypothetical protein LINGRAHAP2_LOCUS30514 [Linum grandiflorum]